MRDTLVTLQVCLTREENMNSRAACQAAALCLLLLGLGSAAAQDPTKVAPKNYRPGFENDHVQVVYVHYGPHEKSALHDHPGGVVVTLTSAHLRFTDQDGKVREVNAVRGEARWFPPFKHKVENLSDTPYDAVYIGVKGVPPSSASSGTNGWTEQDREIIAAFLALANRPNLQPSSEAPCHEGCTLPMPVTRDPSP
jgi:quercetin dioxygenase-like cupin family protein